MDKKGEELLNAAREADLEYQMARVDGEAEPMAGPEEQAEARERLRVARRKLDEATEALRAYSPSLLACV